MTQDAPDPRARFGMNLSLLARSWRRAIDGHLAAAGLTDATWVPLVHLQETGGGITQKDLARRVGVDGSSLVRVLDILCRQNLVERRADASDGRARLIHLTETGKSRVAAILRELAAAEQPLLTGLSDAELAAMLDGFARIGQRMQHEARS